MENKYETLPVPLKGVYPSSVLRGATGYRAKEFGESRKLFIYIMLFISSRNKIAKLKTTAQLFNF